MKRIVGSVINVLAILGAAYYAGASGAEHQLSGYATAGINPTVVFIVTDQYSNGVQGVPITVTCTSGILDVIANSTAADGTMMVKQSGGGLGDIITATCAQVSSGSPYAITASNAALVQSGDTVVTWFDESRRLVNAVAVTSGIGVMTSSSNFDFSRHDYSSNYKYFTIGPYSGISQSAGKPAQLEVFQGTYTPGDRIRVNETTVSGYNGDIYFSSSQPNHFLYAYAVDGSSPTVCAVVTDFKGVGVSGISVNITCTAGTFAVAGQTTDDNGVAYFYQEGGGLGNTLTVYCSALPETSSVFIITENSQTLDSLDKIFSWFEPKTRLIYTVVMNRQTNVLVDAASVSRDNPVNISGNNEIFPAMGDYIDQTSTRPAINYLAHGTSELGDLLRIYQTTIYRYPSDRYHSQIEIPANESGYLLAFATGGANPEVWAVVTDESGNAVRGVDVTFSMEGTGSLNFTNATTSWNGVTKTAVSGAGSVGNTITVSAAGLGEIKIITGLSGTVSSTDRVLGWYDPETHKVFGACVNMPGQVLLAGGTNITDRNTVNITTAGNNAPTISSFGAQTALQPCEAHIGFGTIEAGDYIRLNQTDTMADYDTIIIADQDPAKFLLAFAEGGAGADIRVWAVVMDNKCTGLEGEAVNFSCALGTMNPTGNTVTGYGGYAISLHNSAVLGNTITVTAPGLPPVDVITSLAVAGTGDDWGLAWYDAARLTIWGIIDTRETNVITSGSSYSNPVNIYDNSSNNKLFDVNGPVGHNVARIIYPLNQWTIAFGTAGVGDEVTVNMGYTSNYPDVFIRLGEVKSSFLRAYAAENANPFVRAVVVDENGVGMEGVSVSFSASQGIMSGGPSWSTGLDGTVDSGQTGGATYDVITVASAGYPDVKIYTTASGGVQNYSPAVIWYSPQSHKLNTVMIRYPCYNVNVSDSTPSIMYLADDEKTISVTAGKENSWQTPTYAFIAQGTNVSGDQIRVQTVVTRATDDALFTLPADTSRYLWAFATGGVNPSVWAVVTDEKGNGIADVPVRFSTFGGPMSLTETVTDAAGSTVSVQSGGDMDEEIYVSADGVANTITVKTANAQNREGSTRAMSWYDTIDRIANTAFVNVPDNIMALATNATYTAVTGTPIGDPIEVFGTVQQTANEPSYTYVSVTASEGDQVWVSEPTAAAAPDAIMTLLVPTARLESALVVSPAQVSVGQTVEVTMSVQNCGNPEALTITPSVLNVTGGATLVSGPDPVWYSAIPGGEVRDFTWDYIASAPGNVFFNGQAYGFDSFSTLPMTSTATDSNTVIVQTPAALASSISGPDNVERLCNFTLSMTVNNTGEAAALNVRPSALLWTNGGTAAGVSITSGPTPAGSDILGNQNQIFTWTCAAGENVGTLVFSNNAQGWDANSGNTVTSNSADSNTINVLQGALNLDRISSPDIQVYQGQAGLEATMYIRNTSLMHVTLTASGLNFNGSQQGFAVLPAAGNPAMVAAESSFELKFIVSINKDAPLGTVVIDGTVSGDAETGAMSANGAQETANWNVLEPFNSLRQNYPNPLRLAQNDYTTFEYFVREDVDVSIKIYNLAGELAAILYEGRPGVGRHTAEWHGDNGEPGRRGKTVGSGVYMAVFKIGDYKEIKKVVVIR